MKIYDTNAALSLVGAGGTREVEAAARDKSAAAGRADALRSDHVQLSSLSRELNAAEPDSPDRAAHLDRLRQMVAQGKYSVDAMTVSGSIIEDHLQAPAGF